MSLDQIKNLDDDYLKDEHRVKKIEEKTISNRKKYSCAQCAIVSLQL